MNIYFANYDRNGMTVVEESKYQHAVGRQLLKTALLRAGVSKDFLSKEESLIFAYGPSGKPLFHDLPDVHFNISHTGGLVVCAVGNIPIGIDAERIRPYPKSVLRKMTDRERLYIQKSDRQDEAFMRVWTMKEAMIKLTGEGLAVCDEAAVSGALSDIHCRQLVWQGQYVITAVENTNKNQDCIFSKKVYNRL